MEFSYIDTRTPRSWEEWTLINAETEGERVVIAREMAPRDAVDGIDAIDIDVDDCRDLYVVDSAGHVHRYDRSRDTLERVPCVGAVDGSFGDPRALCVTPDSIYVADSADGRVYAFSKDLLQLRWISEPSFDDPVGIVHDGRFVYVLTSGDGRLTRLDGGGSVQSVVSGLASPEDIAIDSAGNLYVLEIDRSDGDDEPAATVRMFTGDAVVPDHTESAAVTLDREGNIPAGASSIEATNVREVLVAVTSDTSEGTTLYRSRFDGEPLERVVSFERGCSRLVARTGDATADVEELYAIDRGKDEIYLLEARGRTRRNERTSQYDAQLIKRLDSGDRGTRWHRVNVALGLEGRSTQLRLSYAATEDEGQIADSDDFQRIDGIAEGYANRLHDAGVRRISELTSFDPDELAERIGVSDTTTASWIDQARELLVDWKRVGEPNPSDALLESAEGRYLWVKIELIGSEDSSPWVESVRTYFPRTSYLRYLPELYRSDEASAAFLERFLSVFESVFVDIEEEIENVTRYFDPEGTPAEQLPWLGSWMALEMDEEWPEPARRELVSRAPELLKKRGTREGLVEILRIYLRHARPPSAWRSALEAHETAVLDLVRSGSMSNSEAKRKLGKSEQLRAMSGDRAGRQMVVAWSTVLERQREIRDERVNAGSLTEEEAAEERNACEELIRESDQGSLRYLVEYAMELEGIDGGETDDRNSEHSVESLRESYEPLIRESAERDVPYLIEASDLDCIASDDVRKPFSELIGHERGFLVLVRPPISDDGMRTVRRIVDAEQPAHAAGSAVELRPRIRLGGNSYLGINSVLSKGEFAIDRSDLGDDSVLDEREAYAQLGVKSKLDGDTFIS